MTSQKLVKYHFTRHVWTSEQHYILLLGLSRTAVQHYNDDRETRFTRRDALYERCRKFGGGAVKLWGRVPVFGTTALRESRGNANATDGARRITRRAIPGGGDLRRAADDDETDTAASSLMKRSSRARSTREPCIISNNIIQIILLLSRGSALRDPRSPVAVAEVVFHRAGFIPLNYSNRIKCPRPSPHVPHTDTISARRRRRVRAINYYFTRVDHNNNNNNIVSSISMHARVAVRKSAPTWNGSGWKPTELMTVISRSHRVNVPRERAAVRYVIRV